MFNSMQNGWAERDYAYYENEARYEAREAMRDQFHDEIVNELLRIGQASESFVQQERDEAMEEVFDWLFSHPEQQSLFEIALLQIWANYRFNKEVSPMSRLADVIECSIACFANKKTKEKYQ